MAELTSVTLFKTYVGATGTADDALLAVLIEAAELRIRRICNRPDGWLNTVAKTEKIPGSRFDSIPLIYTPVTAITSVKVFSSSGVSTTISSDYYRINDASDSVLMTASGTYVANFDSGMDTTTGYPYGTYGYPLRVRAYPYTEVIYTGGYAAQANIPDDLENAANQYLAWMYFARKEYKVEDHETWEKHLREMLSPYIRRMVIA